MKPLALISFPIRNFVSPYEPAFPHTIRKLGAAVFFSPRLLICLNLFYLRKKIEVARCVHIIIGHSSQKNVALGFVTFQIAKEYISNGEI